MINQRSPKRRLDANDVLFTLQGQLNVGRGTSEPGMFDWPDALVGTTKLPRDVGMATFRDSRYSQKFPGSDLTLPEVATHKPSLFKPANRVLDLAQRIATEVAAHAGDSTQAIVRAAARGSLLNGMRSLIEQAA